MGDIMEGMAEAIGASFLNYFTSLNSVLKLAQAAPMDKIDGFPSYLLWNSSTKIAISIGVGVASVIIALFLFFELASIFNRSDVKGLDGIYWILMAFLKVAVMMAICKNMTVIIGMCFEITTQVVKSITSSELYKNTMINSNNLSESLTKFYKDSGFWTLLQGWITAYLAKFVNGACMVLAEIVCKLRFIEIYVFTAVAPIAFSTFVSREYKNIGVSYIKRLLALGLQGAFIAIVCLLYVVIANSTVGKITVGKAGALDVMMQMMGYSLLLIIAIFQTGGWSKSLLQVN